MGVQDGRIRAGSQVFLYLLMKRKFESMEEFVYSLLLKGLVLDKYHTKNLESRHQSLVLIMLYFIRKKYKQQNYRILFYFTTSISLIFFIAIPSSRTVLQTTAAVFNGLNL